MGGEGGDGGCGGGSLFGRNEGRMNKIWNGRVNFLAMSVFQWFSQPDADDKREYRLGHHNHVSVSRKFGMPKERPKRIPLYATPWPNLNPKRKRSVLIKMSTCRVPHIAND